MKTSIFLNQSIKTIQKISFYTVAIAIILFAFNSNSLVAQNIGINTEDPHSSAMLHIESDDMGLLVPRIYIENLSTAAPVTDPIIGLLVYNTNSTIGTGFHFWNGSLWVSLFSRIEYNETPASGISSGDITNWNTANGWGNHATVGYLTSFSETDPVFSSSAAFGITGINITNWNTAYGWGNHATAGYAPSTHNHSAADITSGTLAVNRGGTGIASYTIGNYIYATGATTLAQRTPAQVLTNIGAASSTHTHETLTRGTYLTGINYNGSAATTWAVDATTTNTASKVVARDASGNFSAGTITATLSGNATTATTATTLQTARTINGTLFNGSANITTANWGTARTITIGSAGKSVNGSGNVSWTLAEIGAASSTHTHNYVDLTSNQTVAGEKTWTSLATFNGGIRSNNSALNHGTGTLSLYNAATTGWSAYSAFRNGATENTVNDGTTIGLQALDFWINNYEDSYMYFSTNNLQRMMLRGDGMFMLRNNNIQTHPDYTESGGGAISWNFAAGDGAVDIWNNYSSIFALRRGFDFRQQTGVSSNRLLLRIRGDVAVYDNVIAAKWVQIASDGTLGVSSSSIKYKQNINDYNPQIENLEYLKTVSFEYNEKTGTPGVKGYGFIAEDFYNYFPELVYVGEDGEIMGIDYPLIGVILVKAYQEQIKKINELESALEKYKDLEQRIIELESNK